MDKSEKVLHGAMYACWGCFLKMLAFVRFGRCLVVFALQQDTNAAVRMHKAEEVTKFQALFTRKYSTLSEIYAITDGLKLCLEQSRAAVFQKMFYNGWQNDHYVGNVFVFAPNGYIIACITYEPGAMHDLASAEWGSVYAKLQGWFDEMALKFSSN